MGYYASYGGSINPKPEFSAEVTQVLSDYFEDVDEFECEIDVSGYDKYYDEGVEDTLNSIKDKITDGEITFTGEDSEQWKFKYENGEWSEYNARIIFEEPFIESKSDIIELIGQLIDQVQDVLNVKPEIKGNTYSKLRDKIFDTLHNWKII